MAEPPVFDHLFLSVGAMKAGTTWIYDVCEKHPDIHFSQEKEIHYFYAKYCRPGLLSDKARMRRAKGYLGFDPEKSMREVLRKRVLWTSNWLTSPVDDMWFNRLFHFKGQARWVADFSNLNALLPSTAWSEIHRNTNALRVLYTLREPLDRTWSHVRFHLKMQGVSEKLDQWSVDELFQHIQEGDYLEHSDYVAAVDRMRDGLPPECLRIDFFDRISEAPRDYIGDLHDFLGIERRDVPEEVIARVVNASPKRTMPKGLAERLAPFVEQQIQGLKDRGITPPASWSV